MTTRPGYFQHGRVEPADNRVFRTRGARSHPECSTALRTLVLFLLLPALLACGCGGAGEPAGRADAPAGMVLIPGGTYRMGSDHGMPDESPAHDVIVRAFWMDEHEVTVAQFAEFVRATGYVTEAERFGWSGVFSIDEHGWTRRDGASWRSPDGSGSGSTPDQPVTQVSWNDAVAYAKWAGKRLPTEAEWELAARGGLSGKTYAWGDDLRPGGRPVANWWQGVFPARNTGEDGFVGIAPVGRFPPNGYGLHDITGNVWEWCADWYAPDAYRMTAASNPTGPRDGTERVMRGGSWLCSENYCSNYRVAGRSHATPDSALNNVGFRCVRDRS